MAVKKKKSDDIPSSSACSIPLNVIQACLLQLLSAFMTAVTTLNGYDYYVEMGAIMGRATGSVGQFMADRAISVLVTLGLAWCFYQGKNWARIAFIVFFAVNIAFMAWGISIAGTKLLPYLGSIDLYINLLQLFISFVVSCLLLTKKSSAWFHSQKQSQSDPR